ncbi:response regulator, partial [bacterium]|nr:response regulator [bacterium]
QRFFRRSGYEDVVTCTSGKEGLALLETSGPFQLVISDYRMPEMNGVEFLSAVRARWPDTVRIVLSGFADTSAIIAATN